jgi:hypothetical protein
MYVTAGFMAVSLTGLLTACYLGRLLGQWIEQWKFDWGGND